MACLKAGLVLALAGNFATPFVSVAGEPRRGQAFGLSEIGRPDFCYSW
jgi:hypothetical protein